MTRKKTRVAILFGGRSAEHDVSILSARSVSEAIPRERFEVVPICIARDGLLLPPEESERALSGELVATRGSPEFSFELWARKARIGVAFPLVHGTFGEDGCLQGFLEILGIPYVGSGVTSSAIGMDKAMMKRCFASASLPIVEHVVVSELDWLDDGERVARLIRNRLRLPFFVKPANAGSSVGVSKVRNDSQLGEAIELALRFDDKALIERGIDARELEVSVLGNADPNASLPGEIIPGNEFYDYADKYITDGAQLIVPAKLSDEDSDEIRRLAIEAFRAIGASGYARVDFFLEKGTDKLFVNEINTIPGFTRISMFPKLWEATDLKYSRLVERLIDLALERGEWRRRRLESTMRFFDEVERLK